MAAWDGTEKAAVFASGMAAISTTMLGLLSPGDHIISTAPVYGGTHYLFEHILPRFGITATQVQAGNDTARLMREAAAIKKPKVLYVETPANPSNALVDLEAVSELKRELSTQDAPVYHVVDNTFLGPIFQRPALQGADLIIYSATKFIGGHSDLVAGVITGPTALVEQLRISAHHHGHHGYAVQRLAVATLAGDREHSYEKAGKKRRTAGENA